MRPENIIFALQKTSSRLEKNELLNALAPDHDFWKGGHLALSPFITFGVKAIPDPDGYHAVGGVPFRVFNSLADKLAARELTGHAALNTIREFAATCTQPEWEMWYKRILAKDLKCGVASSTFNDAAPTEQSVKLFECQLATDMNKVKFEHLPTDAYVEAKYDGNRVLWFIQKNGTAVAYSRNGKLFYNFGAVGAQLSYIVDFPGFPDCGLVIDGEILSTDFNTLQTQARRKTDAQFEGTFMAFDILTIDEFLEQRETVSLHDRRRALENVINWLNEQLGGSSLVDLSYAEKSLNAKEDHDRIMKLFDLQVEAGFEGIMIKDATAPYQFKRTKTWLKLKPTDTFDMTVTGYFEGEGRLVGSLGGLETEGLVDGKLVRTNVGSGFPDDLRAKLWAVRDELPGQIVELLADAISKNKDGTYSLRFPRFIKFRDDKIV